ncbi:MAG: CoA transferase [Pseudomonadales bacterium]
MLTGLKVLDLTADGAALCGHLLADMGADVRHWLTAAHWPQGIAMRAFTGNQRCELLEWQQQPQQLLAALACIDVLIHDRTDAQMQLYGLDPADLEQRFPHLVLAAVTAFGADGPKAHYAATDLIALAASGHLATSGAADQAPVRIRCPQAFAHAAGDAAVAVLIALAERQRSGRGQRLDLSAQQSTTLATLSRSLDGAVGQPAVQRAAYASVIGAATIRNQYELADGWALVLPGILPPLASFMQRLVSWVHDAGHCGDWVLAQDWGGAAVALASGSFPSERWAELEAGIAQLLRPLHKADVMHEAVARRLLIAPILSVADVLASDHINSRSLIVEQNGQRRLGAFADFERSPLPLSAAEHADWTQPIAAIPAAPVKGSGELPLKGVKILDLFWVVAGPGSTRMLADYGATVIHVESRARLDMVRNVPPYVGGVQEPERASCHHSTNANKLNLSLDLSNSDSRPVLDDLIRWADVVTESFAPGVADRLGCGREQVSRLNPNAIYVSSCLMGQSGPWRDYAGYGNTAAAVSGIHALTGHPQQPPMGCFGPYTDFLSVRINALTILGALRHHQQTGEAQFVDMSQSAAALQFVLPECQAVFEGCFNEELIGNDDVDMFPHGVFPADGEDQWLALAIATQAQWDALANYLQQPQWLALNLSARRALDAEIVDRVKTFTAARSASRLEQELQALEIPAHVVLSTAALAEDVQLRHRQHFIATEHPSVPGTVVESTRIRMSRTVAQVPVKAPWFGCDNEHILATQLGYDQDLIDSLTHRGVLQ